MRKEKHYRFSEHAWNSSAYTSNFIYKCKRNTPCHSSFHTMPYSNFIHLCCNWIIFKIRDHQSVEYVQLHWLTFKHLYTIHFNSNKNCLRDLIFVLWVRCMFIQLNNYFLSPSTIYRAAQHKSIYVHILNFYTLRIRYTN